MQGNGVDKTISLIFDSIVKRGINKMNEWCKEKQTRLMKEEFLKKLCAIELSKESMAIEEL